MELFCPTGWLKASDPMESFFSVLVVFVVQSFEVFFSVALVGCRNL